MYPTGHSAMDQKSGASPDQSYAEKHNAIYNHRRLLMIVSFKRDEAYSFDNSVVIEQALKHKMPLYDHTTQEVEYTEEEHVESITITHRTVLKSLIAALTSCLEAQQHRSVNNLMYHIDNSPNKKGV